MQQERQLQVQQARKQSQIRNTLLRLPPLQAHYTDHLSRRRRDWPRRADGRCLTGTEVVVEIIRKCDFIAHARVFGMRWLQQQLLPCGQPQPSPLHLRALYAVPAVAGNAYACVNVSEAVRVHVRCNEIAHLALGLVTASAFFQHAGDCCRWGAAIIARVHGGHCKAVQVQHYLGCIRCHV